jgi:hypothetical protein
MPCRVGLVCGADATCALGHLLPNGAKCVLNADCAQGACVWVGLSRQCTTAGMGTSGATCQNDVDCAAGLRCSVVGLGAECVPEGTIDVGGACRTSSACFGGLTCNLGKCTITPPSVPSFGFPLWDGETCEQDNGPPAAYFHVPRGTGDKDFYRLPFPNDIRMKNGHPDLTGHPTPGPELLGFDPVDRYLRAIEAENDGFSTYPTVFFRFNVPVSLVGMPIDTDGGVDPGVDFIDVTKGDPEYGTNRGRSWTLSGGRGKYICENYLGVRVGRGEPLKPGHTYAVIIRWVNFDPNGGPVAQGEDFAAMLAPAPPSDPVLAAAYVKYQPLREYLITKSILPDTVANAAVFTVGHVRTEIENVTKAVAPLATPVATGWVKCGAGTSPCPDVTGTRACDAAPDPAFDELQALVPLPIFQSGTAPYLNPGDGGGINIATPTVVRTENVCVSLTVPKGVAMPAAGWPLVIYAHGTGGSYRSHITDGVAKALASVSASNTVPIAVLGIDQVEHGPRRGMSTQSPDKLFFNFANPHAARDNAIQGAADQMSLAKLAATLDITNTGLTGAQVKIDPSAIMFWGHSQGATEGALSAPSTDQLAGVLFSGEGASLMDALLTKTSPVNIAAALPYALSDVNIGAPNQLPGAAFHPVLSLIQTYMDPADPLNYAALIAPAASGGHHVFQVYGLNDSFSPPITEATYAAAAHLGVVMHDPALDVPDVLRDPKEESATPLKANVGMRLTAVVREYQPMGYDGHFVAYHNTTAQHDIYRFLDDLAKGIAPTVAP